MCVDPRANFKSFSILSPLVRLRCRNGGLSLAIGLRASCAIGAKVVSLKSTLSTFRVVLVVSGGLGAPAGLVCVYICEADSGGWFGFPIYMQWPFACLAGGLRLFSINRK